MTDPNYCLWLINSPCGPLAWWGSGAAWAQAALTVATFAGTVIYQAIRQRKTDSARMEGEIAMARLITGREFRRCQRHIKQHFATEYSDPQLEVAALVGLAKELTWTGDVRDIALLGQLGDGMSAIISMIDRLAEDLESLLIRAPVQGAVLEELLVHSRGMFQRLDANISRLLANYDDVDFAS